jgi:hypothetical protein
MNNNVTHILNNDFVNVINRLKFVNHVFLWKKFHIKSIGIYNFAYIYLVTFLNINKTYES